MTASNSTHNDQGAIGEFAIGEFAKGALQETNAWFVALSEPVRLKKGIRSNQQPFAIQGGPFPVVSFGWFEALSEPKRLKPRSPAALATYQFLQPTPSPFAQGWFNWLSEPVRAKRRSPAALSPYESYQPAPNPFVATGWFDWLSEPVRLKIGIRKDLQPTLGRGEFIPLNFTLQMQATEQHDLFLAVVYQFNIPVGASVSIIVRSP